jgi:TM2 domain-containing membrane protein YozV
MRILTLLLFVFCMKGMQAGKVLFIPAESVGSECSLGHSKRANHFLRTSFHSPNRLLLKLRRKERNTKRTTAAILAFPLPFGIVGLHRIYFGTKPYVPIVYIATFGGCFAVLPLIDFCVIVFDKNIEQFTNNTHVFMWAK